MQVSSGAVGWQMGGSAWLHMRPLRLVFGPMGKISALRLVDVVRSATEAMSFSDNIADLC